MKPLLATAVLAAAFAHLPVPAQEAEGPSPFHDPQNVPVHPYTLREDLKAFATWPKEWRGSDWLKFTGVLAAVNVAYRYDDEVHEDYGNPGEPDYHEVEDAMPAAMTFGGMWFAAKLAGNEEARWEVDAMRRALVVEVISVQIMKLAIRRDRPAPGRGKGRLVWPRGPIVSFGAHGGCVRDRHGACGVRRRQTPRVAAYARLRNRSAHRVPTRESRCALVLRHGSRRRDRNFGGERRHETAPRGGTVRAPWDRSARRRNDAHVHGAASLVRRARRVTRGTPHAGGRGRHSSTLSSSSDVVSRLIPRGARSS